MWRFDRETLANYDMMPESIGVELRVGAVWSELITGQSGNVTLELEGDVSALRLSWTVIELEGSRTNGLLRLVRSPRLGWPMLLLDDEPLFAKADLSEPMSNEERRALLQSEAATLRAIELIAPGAEMVPCLDVLHRLQSVLLHDFRESVWSALDSLPRRPRLSVAYATGKDLPSLLKSGACVRSLILYDEQDLCDLSPLAKLEGLRELDLTNCFRIKDLRPLRAHRHLQSLKLGACLGLECLDGIEEMEELRELDASDCKSLRDVSALEPLRLVEKLDLNRCPQLADLRPLASLRHLRRLGIGDCVALRDLSPLEGLRELTHVDLSVQVQDEEMLVSYSDISPLRQLTGLRWLSLANARDVTDISALAELTELRHLDLTGTEVKDLSPLSGLHKLKWLHLSGVWDSGQKSLEFLSALGNLAELEIDFAVALTDLAPLQGLRKLRTLHLRNSFLTDPSPLAALNQLERLDLSDHLGSLVHWQERLSDLRPLQNLTALSWLSLAECVRVRDLEPLGRLPRLEHLDLRGCEAIGDLRPLACLKSLRELDLRGCPRIFNLESLGTCRALRFLDCDGHEVERVGVLASAALGRDDHAYLEQHLWKWIELVAYTPEVERLCGILLRCVERIADPQTQHQLLQGIVALLQRRHASASITLWSSVFEHIVKLGDEPVELLRDALDGTRNPDARGATLLAALVHVLAQQPSLAWVPGLIEPRLDRAWDSPAAEVVCPAAALYYSVRGNTAKLDQWLAWSRGVGGPCFDGTQRALVDFELEQVRPARAATHARQIVASEIRRDAWLVIARHLLRNETDAHALRECLAELDGSARQALLDGAAGEAPSVAMLYRLLECAAEDRALVDQVLARAAAGPCGELLAPLLRPELGDEAHLEMLRRLVPKWTADRIAKRWQTQGLSARELLAREVCREAEVADEDFDAAVRSLLEGSQR